MRALAFLLTVFSFLFCVPEVLAVNLLIDGAPEKLENSEFEISVTVTGAKAATNYLKILLYVEGSRESVAKTWNGNEWYYGSDAKQYFPITVNGKSTTVAVKAQLLDDAAKGKYTLSVKRFTASGSPADDSVNTVSVDVEHATKKLNSPSPTPSPKPIVPTATPLIVLAETPVLQTMEPETPLITRQTMTPESTVLATATDIPLESSSPHLDKSDQTNYLQLGAGIVCLLIGIFCLGVGASGIIKSFPHEVSHDRL
jgi:hypothetical protein